MANTHINDILEREIGIVQKNRYMSKEEKEQKIAQLKAQMTSDSSKQSN